MRDASYEEILHFVHGFEYKRAISMQSVIMQSMNDAISNNNYIRWQNFR